MAKLGQSIFGLMKRLYGKPIYRVVMFVLGLPTFLVALVFYAAHTSNRKTNVKLLKEEALKAITASGKASRIQEERKTLLNNKFEFFGKPCKGYEYQKALEAQTKTAIDDAVNQYIAENNPSYVNEVKCTLVDFIIDKLESKGLLLLLSVISSILLYLLLLVCLNAFARYALERICMMVLVIFGVVALVFTILHFSVFDPAINVLGDQATQVQIESFNEQHGLDQPYIVQLVNWLKRILTFDLGNSYTLNESVVDSLARKFPVTLTLTFFATILGAVIALPLGILSSLKPNSGLDYFSIFLAMILMSIPEFWLGMVLILNFAINAGILPATFKVSDASAYVLPSIVMCGNLLAGVTRMTRSSMLEVNRQDYITTAKAKGLSNITVIIRHAFSNALIPIITFFGLQCGKLLGGSAVTERVFSVQGVGSYIINSVYIPDIPIVLSGTVYVAIIISLLNLVIDLLYAVMDPRIKADIKGR